MKTAPLLPVLLPLLVLSAVAAPLLTAQSTTAPPAPDARIVRGEKVLAQINRLDVLAKILPVVLTKTQIKALLPAVEKARAKELEIRRLDGDLLGTLESDVQKAIEDGLNKSTIPSREFQVKIVKTTSAIAVRRQIALNEMIDIVYDACKKNLDAGQLKVMASTLKPNAVAPGANEKEMDDAAKIKFFIRYILLDDSAYDILRRLDAKP